MPGYVLLKSFSIFLTSIGITPETPSKLQLTSRPIILPEDVLENVLDCFAPRIIRQPETPDGGDIRPPLQICASAKQLGQWSLVSRHWAQRCRPHQFWSIRICARRELDALHHLLQSDRHASPPVEACIQELVICLSPRLLLPWTHPIFVFQYPIFPIMKIEITGDYFESLPRPLPMIPAQARIKSARLRDARLLGVNDIHRLYRLYSNAAWDFVDVDFRKSHENPQRYLQPITPLHDLITFNASPPEATSRMASCHRLDSTSMWLRIFGMEDAVCQKTLQFVTRLFPVNHEEQPPHVHCWHSAQKHQLSIGLHQIVLIVTCFPTIGRIDLEIELKDATINKQNKTTAEGMPWNSLEESAIDLPLNSCAIHTQDNATFKWFSIAVPAGAVFPHLWERGTLDVYTYSPSVYGRISLKRNVYTSTKTRYLVAGRTITLTPSQTFDNIMRKGKAGTIEFWKGILEGFSEEADEEIGEAGIEVNVNITYKVIEIDGLQEYVKHDGASLGRDLGLAHLCLRRCISFCTKALEILLAVLLASLHGSPVYWHRTATHHPPCNTNEACDQNNQPIYPCIK